MGHEAFRRVCQGCVKGVRFVCDYSCVHWLYVPVLVLVILVLVVCTGISTGYISTGYMYRY